MIPRKLKCCALAFLLLLVFLSADVCCLLNDSEDIEPAPSNRRYLRSLDPSPCPLEESAFGGAYPEVVQSMGVARNESSSVEPPKANASEEVLEHGPASSSSNIVESVDDNTTLKEEMRGATPPSRPCSPATHAASEDSVARHQSLHDFSIDPISTGEFTEKELIRKFEDITLTAPELQGSTPPPGSLSPVSTAVGDSVARTQPLIKEEQLPGKLQQAMVIRPELRGACTPAEDSVARHQSRGSSVDPVSTGEPTEKELNRKLDQEYITLTAPELKGSTPPPGAASPIHTAAGDSVARTRFLKEKQLPEKLQEATLIRAELRDATPAPEHSVAKHQSRGPSIDPISTGELTQKELNKLEEYITLTAPELQGSTPPPGALSPISTAAGDSVARIRSLEEEHLPEKLQEATMIRAELREKELNRKLQDYITLTAPELRGSTPPPGTTSPISTAASDSVARTRSLKEEQSPEKLHQATLIRAELRGVTPPPGPPSPTHTATEVSVAARAKTSHSSAPHPSLVAPPSPSELASEQLHDEDAGVSTMWMAELRGITPPPGARSPIHTAAGESIARAKARTSHHPRLISSTATNNSEHPKSRRKFSRSPATRSLSGSH